VAQSRLTHDLTVANGMAEIVKDPSHRALVTPDLRGQAENMLQTAIRLRADAHDDGVSP
jgi:hypothetical protein